MKKSLSIALAILLALILCGGALAETVYVSISCGDGSLPLPNAEIEVSDLDGDGALTINDALIAAHNAAFEGGAAAGYATEMTDYGLSMIKLWGEENGGSYGYYVNDASAFSLSDPIADGDYIHAYAFQDLEGWTDTYCYFDYADVSEESFQLTLTALVYDENWVQVPTAVEGAIITINGEDSAFITAADGTVDLSISEPGEYVISARSESMTLVPPVWVVTITE